MKTKTNAHAADPREDVNFSLKQRLYSKIAVIDGSQTKIVQ